MRNIKVLWGMIGVLLIAVIILSLMTVRSPNRANVDSSFGLANQTRTIATIGEKKISFNHLEEQLLNKYGSDVLNQMIDQEVVELEGGSLGIHVTEEEIQQELKRMQQGYENEGQFYNAMKEQLGFTPDMLKKDIQHKLMAEKIAIQGIKISDEEVDSYIRSHPDEFKPHIQFRLQQIVTGSKDQATKAMNALTSGMDFASVAKERSLDDATRDSGGDLGWVEVDDPFIPAVVMNVAKQLKPGEIGKPVQVGTEFIIIRLKDRKEETKVEKETMKELVRKELALSKAPSIKEIIKNLRNKWNAKILEHF